jgi:hypothetical protein
VSTVIEKIAWQLLTDADRFTRMLMIAPRLVPVTVCRPVPADPFAWEVTEHEERLARLWSALYAARAELLAVERLVSLRADRIDLIQTAVTAAWRWAAARAEAIDYTAAYAPDCDTSVDDLLALAGWTPELTKTQASRLTKAAVSSATREQFIRALHNETGLRNTWVDGLLGPDPFSTTLDENGSTQ